MVESTVAIHNDMVHVPVPQYTLSAVRYDIWFGGASAIYEVFTVFVTSLKKQRIAIGIIRYRYFSAGVGNE